MGQYRSGSVWYRPDKRSVLFKLFAPRPSALTEDRIRRKTGLKIGSAPFNGLLARTFIEEKRGLTTNSQRSPCDRDVKATGINDVKRSKAFEVTQILDRCPRSLNIDGDVGREWRKIKAPFTVAVDDRRPTNNQRDHTAAIIEWYRVVDGRISPLDAATRQFLQRPGERGEIEPHQIHLRTAVPSPVSIRTTGVPH